jgi:hypothetical protein
MWGPHCRWGATPGTGPEGGAIGSQAFRGYASDWRQHDWRCKRYLSPTDGGICRAVESVPWDWVGSPSVQ